MRKAFIVAGVAATAIIAALAPASSATAETDRRHPLTLAVYGDAPYGTSPSDTSEFEAAPAFIDSINADSQVSLVTHVGDIHSGKQFCTKTYDQSIADLWTKFKDPLVYTPGDNEWTDCHKVAEGGGIYNATTQQIDYAVDPVTNRPIDYANGNPVANLDLVRSIFFPKAGHTLGGRHMRVLSQTQTYDRVHPTDRRYVENVMWELNDVLFVTLDIPGGSNNDGDIWYGAPTMSSAQSQEAAERTGADLRWLDRAFGQARSDRAKAVMIVTQADMWDADGKTATHLTGYDPFVASIAAHTTQFGKPVLMFNGDSHVYRSDNPLSASAPCTTEAAGGTEVACASESDVHPGYDVPNFHRIVVHGSTFPLEWVKLTIDPGSDDPTGSDSFGPFSWQRMTQP